MLYGAVIYIYLFQSYGHNIYVHAYKLYDADRCSKQKCITKNKGMFKRNIYGLCVVFMSPFHLYNFFYSRIQITTTFYLQKLIV